MTAGPQDSRAQRNGRQEPSEDHEEVFLARFGSSTGNFPVHNRKLFTSSQDPEKPVLQAIHVSLRKENCSKVSLSLRGPPPRLQDTQVARTPLEPTCQASINSPSVLTLREGTIMSQMYKCGAGCITLLWPQWSSVV